MALRNQPYIPLYVQDLLTDEKLNECSASSTGVYIKIMCVMHKSEEYGKILLKQKDKQSKSNVENFARKLNRNISFTAGIIQNALEELVKENVLYIDGDYLCQKRMIRDNDISLKRAEAGQKGGKKTQLAIANPKAKEEAISETENKTESEYEYEAGVSGKDNVN